MSSLLPISVADVKIDWVLGKMAKSYKTTKQCVSRRVRQEEVAKRKLLRRVKRKQRNKI